MVFTIALNHSQSYMHWNSFFYCLFPRFRQWNQTIPVFYWIVKFWKFPSKYSLVVKFALKLALKMFYSWLSQKAARPPTAMHFLLPCVCWCAVAQAQHLSQHEGLHPGYNQNESAAESEFTTQWSKKINKWKKEVVLNVASCCRVSHDVCFALCLKTKLLIFLSFTMPRVGGNLHTVINWVTGDLNFHTRAVFIISLPCTLLSLPAPKADVGLFTYSTPCQRAAAIADREHDG